MPSELTLATVNKRALSAFIDYFCYIMFHALFLIQFGKETTVADGRPSYELEGALNIIPFIIWILTFPVIESMEGKSLGKKICNLTVIKRDGSRLTFMDCMKRRICDWIDFAIFGLPAIICATNTPLRQRLGDMWAKTVVIDSVPPRTE